MGTGPAPKQRRTSPTPRSTPTRGAPPEDGGNATQGFWNEHRRWAVGLAVTIFFGVTGGLGFAVFQWATSRDVTASEQVRTCMAQHSLNKARDKVELPVPSQDEEAIEYVYSRTAYASCEWPPPAYAQADGYSEIVVKQTDGPGEDEASDANSLDRLTATCPRMELAYTYGSQGYSERLDPYIVSLGDVIQALTGEPWTGESPYPYPERDEVVVVHNSKIGLDSARCLE
jgi:hypothetical protein